MKVFSPSLIGFETFSEIISKGTIRGIERKYNADNATKTEP